MPKWEYAIVRWVPTRGVNTWFADSGGNTGYDVKVGKKESVSVIMMQQIARLGGEGWEVFQVIPEDGTRAGRWDPFDFTYHFRRMSNI
jgi:hypothetical protein